MVIAFSALLDDAIKIAENLRIKIKEIAVNNESPITCSFGVASVKQKDGSSDIIKRADEGLYKAKRNGRDRVEFVA